MTASRPPSAPTPRQNSLRVLLNQLRDASDSHRSLTIVVAMAITTALMYVLPGLPPLSIVQGSNIWYDSFANAGVFVLLAMGLNVVIGMAGLLDLGYAAFFAIGAYAYAYSNSPFSHTDLPFIPMLFVGAAVAGIFGILLGAPTLRLRGDYLAIMTLGFGEIVPIVFLNLDKFTQGTNGIGGIYRPEPLPGLGAFSPSSPFNYFIVMVVIVTITMILLYRLQDSRIGRAWNAIREDELAAAANGINTVTTKLLAFSLGATTSGLAGVFNASKLTIVSPDQFLFTVSFTVLAMVILGGMGNIWGVAVGAFVVYNIQVVFLKSINGIIETLGIPAFDLGPVHVNLAKVPFSDYQYLLYGVALVLMMLLRPEGLFPNQRRRQELHIAEEFDEGEQGEITGAMGAAPGAAGDAGGTL
ncbi:MAG TPA: branched-chain amino acid ABC transporter permease [Candidatus Dormibacteraeota bacterium]|nr:branched-chain amino acid ABC transporter permease [Candidatus Dormibacteraeota bacterium]